MKLQLLSLILTLNISLQLCAQSKQVGQIGDKAPVQSGSLASSITAIREQYNRINSIQLKSEKFKYEADGCVEDGLVVYFKEGNTIVKVTESGSIGDGSWVKEYYYHLGKVFFCYDKIVGGPAIGKVTTTERRYYIQDDKILRQMEDKKIVKVDNSASETIQTGYKLLKVYKTKDFAAALCNP
ncbi:hypothetical protein [Pedobacter sp. UBA5917]|jgi:hypothetical protein|uniref:hypothetical protein n=1 Tax=Pedobacter sp. UBA5917 TaxID=1947061 RepID=UPI0025F712C0|nr:hypothetical protein [Pedobacter sp. UBA5917]